MEFRVLRYFLEVARELNITRAAAHLHVTQPTLTRQLHQLEHELKTKLYVRTNYRIRLTEDGERLRQRAEEIVELEERTRKEFLPNSGQLEGDIYLGCCESRQVAFLISVISRLREEHPKIGFKMVSSDSPDIANKLNRGLIDFGVFVGRAKVDEFESYELPLEDVWGLLLKKDDPLAEQKTISPVQLRGLPLLVSRQSLENEEFTHWLGFPVTALKIVATHSLIFNGSLSVEAGLGYAVTLDGIINTGGDSPLCFRPFEPRLAAKLTLVWKKGRRFSPVAEAFLKKTVELADCKAGKV